MNVLKTPERSKLWIECLVGRFFHAEYESNPSSAVLIITRIIEPRAFLRTTHYAFDTPSDRLIRLNIESYTGMGLVAPYSHHAKRIAMRDRSYDPRRPFGHAVLVSQ